MNAQEELEQISELLPQLRKRNPYKVPEGYFTTLDQSIDKSLELDEEFNYGIPNNYFQQLPDHVMKRVNQEHSVAQKNIFPIWMKYAGVAASFLLLLFVGNMLVNPVSNVGAEPSVEIEYLEYLSENIGDLEISSLLNLDILEDNFVIQDYDVYDDSILDFYLESNLNEIELAYLEDIIQ